MDYVRNREDDVVNSVPILPLVVDDHLDGLVLEDLSVGSLCENIHEMLPLLRLGVEPRNIEVLQCHRVKRPGFFFEHLVLNCLLT